MATPPPNSGTVGSLFVPDDEYKRSLLISRTYTAGAYIYARGPSHRTTVGVCALCEVYYYISLALQGRRRRHIL